MITLSRVTTNNLDAKILVPFNSDGSSLTTALHKYISKELKVDSFTEGLYDLILVYHPHDNTEEVTKDLYGKLATNGRLLILATEVLSKKFKEWLSKVEGSMEDIPEFELGKVKGKLLIIDKLEVAQPAPKLNSNMKRLVIQKDPLLKVLQKAKEVVSKHPTLDVLSNVLIEVNNNSIDIVATDLIVTIVGTVPCVHEEKKPFKFLLPFDFFLDVVKAISNDTVTIDTDLESARVTGLGDTYDIEKLDKCDTYPDQPEFPEDNSFSINSDFVKWFHKALDTVSTDTQRPAMQKVFVGVKGQELSLASTNARILFERTFELEETGLDTKELLVSSTIVKALKGFEETEISWNDQHIAFKSDNITLVGTLQDERYPDYRSIFPQVDTNVVFKRAELVDALEKANLTAGKEKVASLHLKKEIGFLVIDAWDVERARKTVVRMPMDYSGPCDMIRFNPESLIKLLKQVDYEHIAMAITQSNKGVLLKSLADPNYTGFIMPIY